MASERWGRSLARYDTERAKMLMEQESEMLGIMFGDGAMSKVGGSIQITITGSKVEDKEYLLEHVRPLFAKLFGIELKKRYRQKEVDKFFEVVAPANAKHLRRFKEIREYLPSA